MIGWLSAIETLAFVEFFRFGRWSYATLNASHILGLALTAGASLPLALRLIGWQRQTPIATLARVLVPVAGVGLAIAVVTGGILFAVKANDYAVLPIFLVKMILVATGALSAMVAHLRHGLELQDGSPGAAHGWISIFSWTGAIVLGRFVAFAGD